MNEATTPNSTLAAESPATSGGLVFPTETEIYILPDGGVIFADLPAELADLALVLGAMQPCAVEPDEHSLFPQPPHIETE